VHAQQESHLDRDPEAPHRLQRATAHVSSSSSVG
jgi:hypothetical protein